MVATAPQQLGINRRRLHRLATTLPTSVVCKPDGSPYTERAIQSWRSTKLPPHTVLHALCVAAGLSPAWLYGEGDESLLPDGHPLFPPPTGGTAA